MTKSARVLLLTLIPWLAVGCGDPNPPNSPELFQSTVLSELGDMINTHVVQHGEPPKGIKDLAPFSDTLPTGLGAARTGEAVVLWGVAPVDPASADPAGEEILAYLKAVPESGGPVLLRNLKVKSLTAEEFRSAPKAAGKIEEPKAKAGKAR